MDLSLAYLIKQDEMEKSKKIKSSQREKYWNETFTFTNEQLTEIDKLVRCTWNLPSGLLDKINKYDTKRYNL
jgi:hypothetical protein